jgi:outer membrane protein OmpA-like peptidoglycan-associated protein
LGTSQQNQQAIEQTSELYQATNVTIAMNMSLILDELLVKTQLADELQAQINVLKGTKETGPKPAEVTVITELQALMEKMGKKNVSLSQVEKQLLETNSQIQEFETSQATLQSHVDGQNVRIQALLVDLQTKEDLLSSKNNKLEQQHLNNQAATDELNKLRIETKETSQKLVELQKSFADNDLEREATVKQAQSIAAPLREKVASLELQFAEALEKNVALADEKNILNQELVPVQSSLKEALVQVALLTTDIENAKTALQHEKDTRFSLTSETEGTKLALEQAQEKYTVLSNKFVELETELTNKTSLQTGQVTTLKQQLADTIKNNEALTDEKKTFIDQLTELQSINDSLNKELAPANASLKEALAQVALLTNEIQTAKTVQKQVEETRLSTSTEAEATKLALDQAQEKYTALHNQHTELEATLQNTNTKQTEQITFLQGLIQQQTASTEVMQGDFEAKLTTAATSLKAANEESTTLKSTIEQLSTTISEQDQTILELTSKTSTENSEQVLKNSQLHEEVAAAKLASDKQAAELAIRIQEHEATINSLNKKLTVSTEQLTDIQENLEQTKTQLAGKTNDITTQQQEIANMLEQAADIKIITDQQAATLKSTEENLTTLQEKQNSLTTSLSDTQHQLVSSQEEAAILQGTIASLTEEQNQLLLVSKDSDNDGINDAEDTCPETIPGAKVNAQGCEEDTDNDGLVNRLDLCPGTASGSTIDSVGCGVEQKTVILEGISFQFGTADLTEEAHSVLNSAAVILQNDPDIRMEVAGHTDSRGDDNANIYLSTLRAEAVLSYLISAGVAADRLQAKGYGSDNPIADNATREGRAKNRRVELKRIDTAPATPQNAEPVPTTNETTE